MGIGESVTLGVGLTVSGGWNRGKIERRGDGRRGGGTHGIGRVDLRENLLEYVWE